MPTEAGSRCALQVARKRRLNVFPDRFGLEQDICDVTLWLAEKYGLSRVRVYVDRQYIQVGRNMAGVTVMTAPRHPEQLTKAAHRVFLALGYTIEDNHRAQRAIGVQRKRRYSRNHQIKRAHLCKLCPSALSLSSRKRRACH